MDEILNKNIVFLAKNLSNIISVLLHLLEMKIISEHESDSIKAHKTSLEQNEKLISVMKKKDYNIFPKFLEILRNTGNPHLADKLDETASEFEVSQNLQNLNIENTMTNDLADNPGLSPSETEEDTTETIQNFEILDNLGEGTYGAVLLGRKRGNKNESGTLYALKVLKTKYPAFDREIKSLEILGDHENIVKLCNSWTERREKLPQMIKILIPNSIDNVCVIQMEYCVGNDLRRKNWLILEPSKKTVTDAHSIILQICNGMMHLHSGKRGNGKEILHRDLKPQNILFYKMYEIGHVHVKIADFGLCRKSVQSSRTAPTKKTTRLGTPFYASPEQQEAGRSEYTTKTDIYSMGLIFIEVLTSTVSGVSFKIQENIRNKEYVYQEKFEIEHQFLERLINQDPGVRPDAEETFSYFQELWNKDNDVKNRHIIVAGKLT